MTNATTLTITGDSDIDGDFVANAGNDAYNIAILGNLDVTTAVSFLTQEP
jgi:hypothetical protein